MRKQFEESAITEAQNSIEQRDMRKFYETVYRVQKKNSAICHHVQKP